jgi:Nucleotidyl transferase AbiEii toxin, Type IV TA system
MPEPAPELALRAICADLTSQGRHFALVGGLAVSVRAEVRFTRDVDIVVGVADDRDAEELVYQLRAKGYTAVASIEHERRNRLATVRLLSPQGVKVDLLFASSGIEEEIVARSTPVDMGGARAVPVAGAEELLAMKILSMSDVRLQDRLDALRLVQFVPDLDLRVVRGHLARIKQRGFDREQDLEAKLASVLTAAGREA